MKKICFATNNNHKLEEVKQLLNSEFQIVSLKEIGCLDELPETQNTLEGNSLQKADFVFKKFKISCFADDTGLEVEALGGAPGVNSAYYAGEQKNSEDNIDLLLKNLSDQKNRNARFRTIITFLEAGDKHTFEGIINGKILSSRKGINGFGYDPVFRPDGYDRTFAEMSLEEKGRLSHRGLAIQQLITFLQNRNV